MSGETKWSNLFAQRDNDGFPIGFMIEAFVDHPPKLFELSLNMSASESSIGSYDTSTIISQKGTTIVPFFFAGGRHDKNVYVKPSSYRSADIGISQSSSIWKSLNVIAFHPRYLIFGNTKDHCIDAIESLSHIDKTAVIQCTNEKTEYMCTSNANLSLDKSEWSTNVKVNLFTSKWILPRTFENELRRSFVLKENFNDINAHVFEVNLFTNKEPFTIKCDMECYTRQVNPFDSRTLWVDFVDDNIVGIPTDFIQDQSHSVIFDSRKNEYTIMSLNKVSIQNNDFLHVALFILCAVLIWRLTHVHSMHSSQKNIYEQNQKSYLFVLAPFFSMLFSLFCIFFTLITWTQWAVAVYLTFISVSVSVLPMLSCIHRKNIESTIQILKHQVRTDLIFQAIMSIVYMVADSVVVIGLITFHMVMTWDLLVGVSYITSRQKTRMRFPLLLFLTFIETLVMSLVNIFFYAQPQLHILSTMYAPNIPVLWFSFMFFLITVSMGIAIRTFTIRSAVKRS